MKILLDQNISFRVIRRLQEHFPEIQGVRENGLENADDITIWHFARNNGFAIVTFDEDFNNIRLLRGIPPKIIWFKTGNLDNNQFCEFFIAQKEVITAFLLDELYESQGCLEFFLIKP